MSGDHFGKQEGRHGSAAAGRVVFEGAGTFNVTKAEKAFCNRKSIQLLAGLDAFSIAEEVAEQRHSQDFALRKIANAF